MVEMKTCISQTMVEFGPSDILLKWASLVKRSIFENNINIINKTYRFLPSDLNNLLQSKNTTSSTYMDNNNLYQGLIETKTIIIPIIRIMSPIKDQKTVIEKQTAPSPILLTANDIMIMHGEAKMGQHIILINKPGPQDSYVL